MKRRKFKQFLKDYWEGFSFIIWILLVSATFTFLFYEKLKTWIGIMLGVISVIYTVVGIKMMCKKFDKEEAEKAVAKENKLRELGEKDKYYIDLVNNQAKVTFSKLNDELLNMFDIGTSLEYLLSFENKIEWICRNRIIGKPDSFIIASCLLYSLIDHPVVIAKGNEDIEQFNEIKFSLNIDIAMNCVFEIISEPSTYYMDNICVWKEEKHPKVNIVVPKGLIKDSGLYERIISTIYRDDLSDNATSIMQLSNLLHLIYLNCQ